MASRRGGARTRSQSGDGDENSTRALRSSSQHHAPDLITIDDTPGRPSCIDLTAENNADIIDLTSPRTEVPIMILSPNSENDAPRRSIARRRTLEAISSDSDEDLPDLSEVLSISARSVARVDTNTGTSDQRNTSANSLSCPICLESISEIRQAGSKVMSTICGHIFCRKCIKGAINASQRCPTCRKRLTMKQIHPIFI